MLFSAQWKEVGGGNVCLEKTKQNAFIHLDVSVLLPKSEKCDILPVSNGPSQTSG